MKHSHRIAILISFTSLLLACEPTSFYTSPQGQSSSNTENPPPGPIPGQPNSFRTNEDTPLSSQLQFSVSGASVSSYQIISSVQHGTLSLNSNGSFNYSPAQDYNGSDSFRVLVRYTSSNILSSQQLDASIVINPVNDAPVARAINLTTAFNTALTFTIGANGEISDVDDALTALNVTIPSPSNASGQIVSLGSRQFRFTPSSGFRGTASFSYTVSDVAGATATASLSIAVGSSVSMIRPALAVRGTGCIVCHASIHSNVVTDFAYGDSYFFGQADPAYPQPFNGSIYGDHGGSVTGSGGSSWSTGYIQGSVYVPKNAFLPASLTQVPMSLAQYLTLNVGKYQVISPGAPKPAIIEQNSVYIGAPSVQTIQDAVVQKSGSQVPVGSYRYFKDATSSLNAVQGLVSGVNANGSLAGYLRNSASSEFLCEGDLVVNQTLFLENLRIRTNDNGCRIYALKSVFIQGAITFLGSSTNRNLQISSSSAILMGLGRAQSQFYMYHPNTGITEFATDSLKYRILDSFTRYSFHTRDTSRSTTQKLEDIYDESGLISNSSTKLWDAAAPGGVVAANDIEVKSIAFERLLLNAPNVQSRYLGNFKGVVISEFALFGLGAFKFEFDPVFSQVPVLPLIQEKDYLLINP